MQGEEDAVKVVLEGRPRFLGWEDELDSDIFRLTLGRSDVGKSGVLSSEEESWSGEMNVGNEGKVELPLPLAISVSSA